MHKTKLQYVYKRMYHLEDLFATKPYRSRIATSLRHGLSMDSMYSKISKIQIVFYFAYSFLQNWCTLLNCCTFKGLTWYGWCCETRFSFLSPFNLDSCASPQKIGLLASNLLYYTSNFMMYAHNFMRDTKVLCIICYWIDVVRLYMAQKSCIGIFLSEW